jgi:hypothetical protein
MEHLRIREGKDFTASFLSPEPDWFAEKTDM